MKIHDVVQGSEEWQKCRLGRFTASDAQAIANSGKGLDTLVFEKVAERLTGKSKEEYTNEAMENGIKTEEAARNSYELTSGILIKQVGFISISDYVGASPDGLIEEDGLLEIKCPTSRVYAEYLYYDKISPQYMAQMQMQLFVTGRTFVDYAVYNPDFKKSLIIKRIDRDEEAIKKIEEGLKRGIGLMNEILSKLEKI